MGRVIFPVFIVWRLLLFIPLLISEKFLPFRSGFEYTSPSHFVLNSISPLLSAWANFDGVYYLTIAASGYTVDNAVFFPMYPLLIKILTVGESHPFSTFQLMISVGLSSVIFFFVCALFYKLVKLDYPKNIALWSVVFLLIFPTSFFGVAVYSDGLFLLLVLLSFYFARKRMWFFSTICAALSTATRLVGIAIIPALIIEFLLQEKTLFKRKALSLLLASLGITCFAIFNYLRFGNAFQFVKAQSSLHNNRSFESVVLFPQTIYRYTKILTNLSSAKFEWWVALLEISVFLFAISMIYIAWKKKIRLSYLVYAAVALLIPASTGTFTGIPRYTLVLFPIFIVLALIKNKWIKIIYSIISIILLFTLLMLFSKGYYVS